MGIRAKALTVLERGYNNNNILPCCLILHAPKAMMLMTVTTLTINHYLHFLMSRPPRQTSSSKLRHGTRVTVKIAYLLFVV